MCSPTPPEQIFWERVLSPEFPEGDVESACVAHLLTSHEPDDVRGAWIVAKERWGDSLKAKSGEKIVENLDRFVDAADAVSDELRNGDMRLDI